MKFKLITIYITLFWFAIFLAGLWVLKMLIQASVPEFGVGIVGGVIYGLIMRAIYDALSDSINNVVDEFRRASGVDHD